MVPKTYFLRTAGAAGAAGAAQKVLECCSEPASVRAIARKCSLSVAVVQTVLKSLLAENLAQQISVTSS